MADSKLVIAQFEGFVECASFNEKATISVRNDCLQVVTSFDQLMLPYESLKSISYEDFSIRLDSADGLVALKRLGREAEWLYEKLYSAYNEAVVAALRVKGSCAFESKAGYLSEEGSRTSSGTCIVRVYEDCVCLLAPNEQARRLPLCYLTNVMKGDYSRTLELATGERYVFSRMGRELENFDRVLGQMLKHLRERTLEWHQMLAPKLDHVQAASAAKLVPIGRSALIDEIATCAPALLAGIEARLSASRIASYYPWLKRLSDNVPHAIGSMPFDSENVAQAAVYLEIGEGEGEPEQDNSISWVVAPVQGGKFAAVELVLPNGEAAATYLYAVEGSWRDFTLVVSRALEAASFDRGPVLIPASQLKEHAHAADALLVSRTPALQSLRSRFVGRAIHTSEQRWLSDIDKALGSLR